MEALFEFLAVWWWAAPTTVGLGAVGYVGLTTGRRRARRLALDAARHEEQLASRALLAARADARGAQAVVLQAQAAQRGASAVGAPSVAEARRALQQAKQAQKAASLALRAARSRIRAERTRMHSTSSPEELPLAQLVRAHDALNGRWLEYETDVETALAFPQMTDPHHPVTAAFLRAQQEAQWRRPASPTARMTAEDFVAYRAAVRRMETAFTAAEDAALRASAARARAGRRTMPRPTHAESRPAPAAPAPEAVRARPDSVPRTAPRTDAASAAPPPTGPDAAVDAGGPAPATAPAPAPPRERLPRGVWPVPGRTSRPPAS